MTVAEAEPLVLVADDVEAIGKRHDDAVAVSRRDGAGWRGDVDDRWLIRQHRDQRVDGRDATVP